MTNKQKTFLIILLATILAFLAVFFINKNSNHKKDIENIPTIENYVIEDSNTKIEENKVEIKPEIQPEIQIEQKAQKQIKTPKLENIKYEQPVIKEIKEIKEKATNSEETAIDNGIKKIEGTDIIEVTREFKIDTPAKYSFK